MLYDPDAPSSGYDDARTQQDANPGTIGTAARVVGLGVTDVGAATAGASRYLAEYLGADSLADFYRRTEQLVHAGAHTLETGLAPETRRKLEAAITSDAFWEAPWSTTALKLTRMTPQLAASLVPAGLVAGAGAKIAAASIGGGAINAGQVIDEVYQQTDALPDVQLRQMSPRYAAFRQLYSETEARSRFNEELLGMKPALNLAVGVIGNALGPAGKAAGLMGGVERTGGALASGLAGAAEGAVGGALQGGVANASVQSAMMDAGVQKEFDSRALVDAVLEPAALGAVMSGPMAAISTKGRRAKPVIDDEVQPATTPSMERPAELAVEDVNQGVKGVGTGVQPKPPENAAVGNPESAPTRSETSYPKGKKAKKNAPAEPPTNDIAPDVGKALEEKNAPAEAAVAPPAPGTEPAVTPATAVRVKRARTKQVAEPQPEVQSKPWPTEPAPIDVPVEAKDVAISPRPPRVLPDVSKEGREKAKAQTEAFKRIFEPTKERAEADRAAEAMQQRESGVAPTSHKSKADQAKKAAQGERAKALFEKHTREDAKVPVTPEDVKAFRERINSVLADATAEGVKPPGAVTHATPDHLVWLREVADVAKTMGKKTDAVLSKMLKNVGAERAAPNSADHIVEFLTREKAMRDGDFAAARAERKAQGEAAKRQKQGEVDQVAPAAETGMKPTVGSETEGGTMPGQSLEHAEKRIVTAPDGSKKEVVGVSAASGEKLSPAEKARMIAERNAQLKAEQGATPKVTQKVTPVVAEKIAKAKKRKEPASPAAPVKAKVAKDVDRAAKRVEAPSEAQKEAGNYKKAHIDYDGHQITIETPRGEARSGVDPDGKAWSVKMPDHYGYIKRTNGADGDHVDVYVGRKLDSDKVFVIDQRDLATGKFDEHKAMLGYETVQDAINAYDRAFSDGRGTERVKDITTMSRDEFKEWLGKKANTTKEAGAPEIAHADALAVHHGATEDSPIRLPASGYPNGVPARVTGTVAEFLDRLDLSHLSGVPRALSQFFIDRLRKFAGDIPVYVIDSGVGLPQLTDSYGMHYFATTGRQVILLRSDALATQSGAAHVVLHEAAHGMTARVLLESPRHAELVGRIMGEIGRRIVRNPELQRVFNYALQNPREFIAEAFSNPRVQEELARMPLSRELSLDLKLGQERQYSVWDAMRRFVRSAIQRFLGPVPDGDRMMDAVMRVSERIEGLRQMEVVHEKANGPRPVKVSESALAFDRTPAGAASKMEQALMADIVNRVRGIERERQEQRGVPNRLTLSIATFDYLARKADEVWGGADKNPIRKIQQLVETMRVRKDDRLSKFEPLVTRMKGLEDKYKKIVVGADEAGNPRTKWDEIAGFLYDESHANIYADRDIAGQTHLKGNGYAAWARARHAELSERYAALPDDAKKLRREILAYTDSQQNDMGFGLLNNSILAVLGKEDKAMAERIWRKEATDADRAALGDAYATVQKAMELAKLGGAYVPFMRRGDYVVRAELHVAKPTGAREIAPNIFEFTSKEAAEAFAAKSDRTEVKSVWVDETTGEQWVKDEDGKQVKITPQDTDAVQRWRTTTDNQYMELFETQRAAEEAAASLSKHHTIVPDSVKSVVRRRYEPGDFHTDIMSHQMVAVVNGLKRSGAFHNMPKEMQQALVDAWNQEAIRVLGSTRIQSRRLPRRNVKGYSEDLTHNMLDYAVSSSGYLAKLEHLPKLEAALKEMHGSVDDNANKHTGLARSLYAHEIERRLAQQETYETRQSPWISRLMSVSFMDKLASPSHSVINATQPTLVTWPVLAGKYGPGRAAAALIEAYKDINAKNIFGAGVKDTVGRMRSSASDTVDYIGAIRDRLSNANERKLIDRFVETGVVDQGATLEIARTIRSPDGLLGKIDPGLGYLEGIVRQMPQAVEAVNRTVSGLAAFRLEMRRNGGDFEAASRYAMDVINQTQFNYSVTNAAPLMNHPLARISFQFKKFGVGMYQLIGEQVGKALHGRSREERIEGVKTLAYIAAIHTAFAGTLGLPTEPFKYLVMAAGVTGLTDKEWGDVERWWRGYLAENMGKDMGEIVAKGLPRALGVDVSSRVGLDSLTSFGEPRMRTESETKRWLFDTVAGAPVSLVGDWFKGSQALANGDVTKAAELMIPVKAVSDSLRAYRQMTEGKKNASERQTMTPYTPGEAALRVAGFTPQREAEHSERRTAFYNQQKQEMEDRRKLVTSWVTAEPAKKADAWASIQKFNADKPRDAQISMSDLTAAARKRKTEDRQQASTNGVRTTKRDKYIYEQTGRVYNVQ